MTKGIVIIGNSGAAKECLYYADSLQKIDSTRSFKGFLAFEAFEGSLNDLEHLTLGNDDSYIPDPSDEFVIGVGNPKLRDRIYQKWKPRGVAFLNLIHPSCQLDLATSMGEGNILAFGTRVSRHVTIGNNNYFNGDVVISHDVSIGDSNFFGPSCFLLGEVSVGCRNSFAVNSVAMPKARIGNDNIIAPGSYVYKGCRDHCVMVGNPAFNCR